MPGLLRLCRISSIHSMCTSFSRQERLSTCRELNQRCWWTPSLGPQKWTGKRPKRRVSRKRPPTRVDREFNSTTFIIHIYIYIYIYVERLVKTREILGGLVISLYFDYDESFCGCSPLLRGVHCEMTPPDGFPARGPEQSPERGAGRVETPAGHERPGGRGACGQARGVSALRAELSFTFSRRPSRDLYGPKDNP